MAHDRGLPLGAEAAVIGEAAQKRRIHARKWFRHCALALCAPPRLASHGLIAQSPGTVKFALTKER
jgi:hypothetical protein